MAKEFKRSAKDSKNTGRDPKKGKDDKKGRKPAFERYRDDSRPSDFGSASPRRASSSGDDRKKPFGEKPFRKNRDGDSENEREEKPKRFSDRDDSRDEKPAFRKRTDDDRPERRTPFKKDKPFRKDDDKPSFRKKSEDDDSGIKTSNNKAKTARYTDKGRKPAGDKPAFRKRSESPREDERTTGRKSHDGDFYESKPAFLRESDKKNFDYEEEYQSRKKTGAAPKRSEGPKEEGSFSRPYKKRSFEKKPFGKGAAAPVPKINTDGSVRLNKYIANAGICSRREADELIESGVVQVNGKIITEMGYKVKPTDVIKYGGQTLKKEKLVYLILNKPKDYITTVDDPQQRRTVLELIQGACRERIYPVGRLDRATTGLLMFTNDGELTKKLTHPRYGVRKVYHVELDKPLKRQDLDKIAEGIELEDGPIKVDEISYVGDGKDKASVGVEIHSGKNRIVRRIFENFGYNVRKLDRVVFGPLTKKDLPRGRWRLLTEAEVGMMKMISSD
ncbi:MAG TPA: pseudouridine synthase [Bacteroidia bacterium]|jgi:23S rRNA pseudouridine2605 synthase